MGAMDIPELDRRGLRNFGLATGLLLALLLGIALPALLGRPLPAWPWILGGSLAAWALLAPGQLRPVYRGWMRFGLVMGRITTPVILAAVFFLVLTPTSFLRRVFGGEDALARRFDAQAESYRVKSRTPSARNMERPY
jgi:O-antigen/teichoic acid export membrane protein